MKNREKTVDNVAGNANSLAAQSDDSGAPWFVLLTNDTTHKTDTRNIELYRSFGNIRNIINYIC